MILFLKSIEDNIDEKIGYYVGVKDGKKCQLQVRYYYEEDVKKVIEI